MPTSDEKINSGKPIKKAVIALGLITALVVAVTQLHEQLATLLELAMEPEAVPQWLVFLLAGLGCVFVIFYWLRESYTDLSTPPSLCWQWIRGMPEIWRLDKTSLSERYPQEPSLLPVRVAEFKEPSYREWTGRDARGSVLKELNVICGPAGVGKTTYLYRVLRNVADDTDVILHLPAQQIQDALDKGESTALWDLLREVADRLQISRFALSYALRTRRVLLVIEDVHHVHTHLSLLLPFLVGYLRVFHRSRRVSLILSTRDDTPFDFQTIENTNVIHLHPLDPMSAQEFFGQLCIENGVPSSQVVRHGDQIGNAFVDDLIRTPLFIVICAILVSTDAAPELELSRVLEMSAADVFERFFAILCERSSDEIPLNEIGIAYRRLAFQLWPPRNGYTPNAIADALHRIAEKNPGQSHALSEIEFFEQNGFLFRLPEDRNLLSFPHQSMADYLAADLMHKERNYRLLAKERDPITLEGPAMFLADMIKTADQTTELLDHSLVVTLKVLETWTQRGESLITPSQCAKRAALWAIQPNRVSQSSETWQQLARYLDTRYARWLDDFCNEIDNSSSPLSKHAVEALSAFGSPAAKRKIEEWLQRQAEQPSPAFEEAVVSPHVQDCLFDILKVHSLNDDIGKQAFRLIWRSTTSDRAKAIGRWLTAKTSVLIGPLLEFIAQNDRPDHAAVKIISSACRNLPVPDRKSVSLFFSPILGKTLVPAGEYPVEKATVTVRKPLLVPRLPEILRGRFRSTSEVDTEVRRQLRQSNGAKVMDWGELRAAFHHFNSGSMFIPSKQGICFFEDASIPETFRSSGSGNQTRTGLVVLGNDSEALSTRANSHKQDAIEAVYIRLAEVL